MSRLSKALCELRDKICGEGHPQYNKVEDAIECIAKNYPESSGGGGVLTIGMVNTSLSTEVYKMDKTFEEIAAAIEARQGVQLIYDFEKKCASVFMLTDFERQSYGGAITFVMFSKVRYLGSGMVFEGWSIASDGTIEHFRSDEQS